MNVNVALMLFPSVSHYYASLSFAKYLNQNGFNVIFLGSSEFRFVAEAEGNEFYSITYMSQYYISSPSVFLALLLKTLLDRKFTLARYLDWYRSVQSIMQNLQKLKPMKIYLDEHLAHYYPIIHTRYPEIDIELINTKLSTSKNKGYPPLNSTYIPKKNLISNIICEILWGMHFAVLKKNFIIQRISLLCLDEEYFINRYLQRTNLSYNDFMAYNGSFYKTVRNLKVNILAPSKLEFTDKILNPFEEYIDLPIQRNESHLINPEYNLLLNRLIQDRKDGAKIIYCSFGTLSGLNKNSVSNFINRLVRLFLEEEEWRLVIATDIVSECLKKKYNNIFVIHAAPQLNLLPHCDLMISHGGLTSIKECLQFNVAMIVYPTNKHFDQNGNAVRIAFHGYGLMGDIKRDSIKLIRRKILVLLENTDRHRVSNKEIS